MALDIFAKIGDIKGESLDAKHKDEVEVLSWSWGMTQSGSIATGGGGGAGRASFNDFNFTHRIDKASPNLMKACATGDHIKEATITVRKAGKGQQEFLIIKMNDIIITSVNPSGSGEATTAENVALQFAKVDLEYRPQRADGSLDAGLHSKYDIEANKEFCSDRWTACRPARPSDQVPVPRARADGCASACGGSHPVPGLVVRATKLTGTGMS